MPVIPYPGVPRHTDVELQPIAAARVNRSALSNARQALDMGYSWWQAAVTVASMEIEDAREWRVFFGRLRGPVNSFQLPVTGEPQHGGGFAVRARGAGSGYSLSSDGWPASSTVLKAGEYVTVGEQLMVLDADVKTSAAGIATLQFHSPLRSVVADDTAIETAMPFLSASLPDGAPALKLTVDLIQAGFGFSVMGGVLMDAATIEALGGEVVYAQWFAWLDIEGDPVRVVSGVQSIAFAEGQTGDADLDGKTFEAIPGDLIDVGDVQHDEDGSDTVSASLSGLPFENTDLLDVVGQRAKWRKREARLWFRLLEPSKYGPGGQPVEFAPLPIHRYYSGHMVGLSVEVGEEDQTIAVRIENYQAALSEASGLTYLHQSEFDSGDRSAEQTLAAANGMQKAGISGSIGSNGYRPGRGGLVSDR